MNISYTTNNYLCLGCGLCEDICPTHSIHIDRMHGEYRPIIDDKTCLDEKCGRCATICPGLGIKINEMSHRLVAGEKVKDNRFIGRYIQLYTGHCTDEDIRFHSASGGMVTGLLVYLLEKRIIDGAVVTRFSAKDNITPETIIARTREELISARSSKYCPVTMQGIRKRIRESEGKYVIVGLPCHIHGFRKIEQTDKKFKEHVYAYWGLYCSSGRTFNLTDYVLKCRGIDKRSIRYFAYRDEGCLGSMVVKYNSPLDTERVHKEGYGSYFNLRSFFIPRRCHYCIDHAAELADISFGDIHIKPYSDDKIGVNSIIVRNAQMLEMLLLAEKEGQIVINQLQEEVLVASQKMAQVKKQKYGSLVKLGKRLGMKVPDYDMATGNMGLLKTLVYMLNLNVQYQVGHHRFLWPLIDFTLKKYHK